ncbi:MAG: enoyl-CoA hydratase/isomerase family protein [Desulfomonilia bacterium]|nr:enoyl-CoA hydratase/isomerase family protein [Desulfomonilia bacterium]
MSKIDMRTEGHIAFLTIDYGENRLNPTFLGALTEALDTIVNHTDATVLIATSAHEKIFSNGIDLQWLIPVVQSEDMACVKDYVYQLNRCIRTMVLYPLFTIAAINGHAFAGGAVMSCCFDFRFMRSDRGFFCLPEVDLGVPFLPGMTAVMRKAIPRFILEDLQYSGRKLTPQECEQYHIVTKACPRELLMKEAMTCAARLNKRRDVIAALKQEMNRDVVYALDVHDPPVIEAGWQNWFTDQIA